MVYPATGEAPCGSRGTGCQPLRVYRQLQEDHGDRPTVVFQLCAPDVAFLSKIAFSAFAINDSG